MPKKNEDAPTNATGAAVVGTGDDKTTWKRKKKKSKIVKRLKATYEVGRKPDKELVLKKEGTFIEMRGGFKLNKHQPRKERPASPTKSWNVDKGDKVTLKPQDREYPNQTGTITKVVGIDKRYGRGGVVTYKIKVKGKTIERKTYELVFEGKNMDWLHKLIKQGKSAEEISRIMELDRDTVEALMEEDSVADIPPPQIEPDGTFASMPVFKVNGADFAKCKFGKDKFSRWAKHIDTNSDTGKKIHAYAKKNPKKSIIVQHEKSGHMLYLKKYSKANAPMVKKGDEK